MPRAAQRGSTRLTRHTTGSTHPTNLCWTGLCSGLVVGYWAHVGYGGNCTRISLAIDLVPQGPGIGEGFFVARLIDQVADAPFQRWRFLKHLCAGDVDTRASQLFYDVFPILSE